MSTFHPEDFLVLVVDDLNQNLQVIGEILEKQGYETTFATNGEQALARIKSADPDLILLDLMMPEMNGLEVCQIIKKDLQFKELPIVFLTASDEKTNLIQAFEFGAVDYVTKPFHVPELLARVRNHLELKQTRDQLKKVLEQQKHLIAKLEKLATTDPLTGILNRRHFLNIATKELSRYHRYNCGFSLLMLDLDHFKRINDTYGHSIGDEVLKAMTEAVLKSLRKADSFGRFGGEEFAILLPETNLETAREVAERIRQTITKLTITPPNQLVQITVSIGVTTCKMKDESLEVLLQRADKALYQAKNLGRDRVVTHLETDN
ncbi:diguanylate cyclase [Oscillatoria salina]|uniref:diguanylate cyclase n=1 Tax=Oscillatoria salina TaxID=331517 RepID=UPI001CCC9E83|nr:diguanylate cyclase [Oscillatoria salina]MBZ8180232.1 diguanylate cyclase [Oscillatoria salina IIICB1]